MNREQARDIAKGKLADYLRQKGINPRKPFSCLNPQHADKNPSMSFDSKRNRVKCFSCGKAYDVFDLVAMDYGLTEDKEMFGKTYEIFHISVDNAPCSAAPRNENPADGKREQAAPTDRQKAPEENRLSYFDECRRRIGETDYYRGLSRKTLDRHCVGYDPCFKTKDSSGNYAQWKALIIPTGKNSFVARNTDAGAGHKDRYRKRGGNQIFGYKTLQTATKPCFVVEGEIDAMSVEEVGGAAIGLGSYDNVPLLLKLVEGKKPAQPLIIAFDNETEPDKQKRVADAEKRLSEGLERLQIPFYRLHPYGKYHDANEALMNDRDAFAEAIAGAESIEKQAEEDEREAYLSTNAGAHLQEFINGIGESVNTEAIPTGFETLDNVLDGGLYEGLYSMGAISSLGKTTLIMQIADMVAQSGHDVLIISLEMARFELMSKSISRHTLQIALENKIDMRNAKTARAITDGKRYVNYSRTENELIQSAITAYGKYAHRLYIHEGVNDIGVNDVRQKVEKHIKYTGNRPLVIVDYIQILSPYNERFSDKQNTDKAVLELKRISRDCKVPVIGISSFNRNSYKAEAMFEAFKESGSIEYTSDVVIGLQLKGADGKDFNPTEEKKKDPRSIELVILKNRQGKVGDKIGFNYYPMFNYFEDKGLSN